MRTTSIRVCCGILVLGVFASMPLACDTCGGSGGGAAPSATASASAAPTASVTASTSASASSARPRGFGIRASGVTGAIFQAASALDLKPEQKTALEQIGSDLHEGGDKRGGGDSDAGGDAGGGGGGSRAEMKEAQADLAAGVKAGKIDTAKMDAHHAAIEKAMVARQAKEADALNRLYALLDATQRSAVAASVRSNEEKRAARMKAHERPNTDAGPRPSFARMKLERYTKDLDLDAEQQKKAQALLPKDDATKDTAASEDAKKHRDTVLAAFEKDGFDAKKLTDPNDAKKARAPMDAETKFFAQYVGILKPDQRERLATRLQKSEGRGGEGRGGGHLHGGGGGSDDEEQQEP